jgi:hypothetical protein
VARSAAGRRNPGRPRLQPGITRPRGFAARSLHPGYKTIVTRARSCRSTTAYADRLMWIGRYRSRICTASGTRTRPILAPMSPPLCYPLPGAGETEVATHAGGLATAGMYTHLQSISRSRLSCPNPKDAKSRKKLRHHHSRVQRPRRHRRHHHLRYPLHHAFQSNRQCNDLTPFFRGQWEKYAGSYVSRIRARRSIPRN